MLTTFGLNYKVNSINQRRMLENMVHISLIDKGKAKALKVGSLFGKEPHNSTSGVNAQQPDIRENFTMHLIFTQYQLF